MKFPADKFLASFFQDQTVRLLKFSATLIITLQNLSNFAKIFHILQQSFIFCKDLPNFAKIFQKMHVSRNYFLPVVSYYCQLH